MSDHDMRNELDQFLIRGDATRVAKIRFALHCDDMTNSIERVNTHSHPHLALTWKATSRVSVSLSDDRIAFLSPRRKI